MKECYKEGDFVQWVVENLSDTEVEEMLSATIELRKSPEQRETERFEAATKKWKEENPEKLQQLLSFD